jgi:hypothetical protein
MLNDKKGENYIDVVVIILVVIMVLALIVAVIPAIQAKNQLDYFANELVRTAEIEGQIGNATTARAAKLRETTSINPTITWDKSSKIQLNNEFTVTLKYKVNIGFGGFGNFPVNLESKASGKSEVYWKS